MNSIGKLIGSIVGVYIVFNLVFVGFQYLEEKEEHDQMRSLKGMMDSYSKQLQSTELTLKEKENNVTAHFQDLEQRAQEMNRLVKQFPNGMPVTVYADYQKRYRAHQQDSRNYKVMVADLEAYQKNYKNLVELNNGTVAEYNELNEQVGETWFIVPGFRGKP